MHEKDLAEIAEAFGPVKWTKGSAAGLPGEGWFLLEISPISSTQDLLLILADIHFNRDIFVQEGAIHHLYTCEADHQLPKKLRFIEKLVVGLEPRTFKIAVHPGLPGILFGQPLAIAIDPIINYEVYPDHPHLNTGGHLSFQGRQFFIPDSFCYQSNIAELYSDPVERYKRAFAYITDWLLRHVLWEESRNSLSKGYWLGPEEGELEPSDYIEVLNPAGLCRCRSGKTYGDCHLSSDLEHEKRKFDEEYNPPIVAAHIKGKMLKALQWKAERKTPQDLFYSDIRRKLKAAK